MSDVVEQDRLGTFSLYLRNITEEEVESVKNDFYGFRLIQLHRPEKSRNVFLRFRCKEDAEFALRRMKYKYDMSPAINNQKRVNKNSSLNSSQVETKYFAPRDSGSTNGSVCDSTERGWTGHKSKQNDLAELQDGIKEMSLSTSQKRSLQADESNGSSPQPSQSLTVKSPVSARSVEDDGPPLLIPAYCTENGMPRLVPLNPLQNTLNPTDKPVLTLNGNNSMPKRGNEMFVANISENTSEEDVLDVFKSLHPVSVSPLKYTDINAHIPYRIVVFSSCKAVTHAVKHFQNLYLHGRYWKLTRVSTLIELAPVKPQLCKKNDQ